MDDLISRQAAIDMFQNLAYDDWNQLAGTTWANAYSEAAEMVKNLPSAPPERKTGRWEQDNPLTKPRCSECGEPCFGLHGFDYTVTSYCPNCGARMVKGEEHGQKVEL